MEDDSCDSDGCSGNSILNHEIKTLTPKNTKTTGFLDDGLQELLVSREEHNNDADGAKTAEVKPGYINAPPFDNASAFQFKSGAFISKEDQHLINEIFCSLQTGNKIPSNTRILDKLPGAPLKHKTERFPDKNKSENAFSVADDQDSFTKKGNEEDSGCSFNIELGEDKDNGRHDYMKDCSYKMNSFCNENLSDKSESSSSDESDITVIYIPDEESDHNRHFNDTALHSSVDDIPNENNFFIGSKQEDNRSVVDENSSSIRKGHRLVMGCFDNVEDDMDEGTRSQNHTKHSLSKDYSFEKDSLNKSEANSFNENDYTTISVPYAQKRNSMYSSDSVKNAIIRFTPNENKSCLVRSESNDSAKNTSTVLNEDSHYVSRKSDGMDTIFSDDSSAYAANHNCTNKYVCESLKGSTTKKLCDKTEATLCKEVHDTVAIAPYTKCPQQKECNCTKDYNFKHESTDHCFLRQITETNAQILNLSSSKEFVKDGVKSCPNKTMNANLTGLAVKACEQYEDGLMQNSNKYDSVTKSKTGDETYNINSNNADAPSDFGTLTDKQSKQCLSTEVNLQDNLQVKIANPNLYSDVSYSEEATSGAMLYNVKVKEKKLLIPVDTECLSDMRKDYNHTSFVAFDNVDEGYADINAKEHHQPHKYVFNEKQKLSAQENVLEEQTTCSLRNMLSKLESPFNWLPDIQVLDIPESKIQEDFIHCLTEKEKEFSRAKTNIFREVVVYLVLAYEKAAEDCLVEAIDDLSHCYSLLGNPQFLPAGMQLDFKDMHITAAEGNEYYMKMKERIAQAKQRALKHTMKVPFDAESIFQDFTESQREKILSNICHLISCSSGTHSDQSKEMPQNKNIVEYKRSEVDRKLVDEGQLFVDDAAKQSPQNRQAGITSESNVNQHISQTNYNFIASNTTEKDTTEIEHKSRCFSPGINSKETDCSKGILTINANDHKQAVGSKDDMFDSDDSSGKIYSSHLVTHPASEESVDVKSAETEIEVSCTTTAIEEERKAALIYAVTAAVAHVAYFSESYQQSYEAAQVCKYWYSQLGNTGKATLLALKGSVFLEYGIMGNKLALPYFKEALSLEPDYWEWNLLCGKVIARLHRLLKGNTSPEDEELQLLEKAAELNPNDASCLVQLANVYRSLSHFQYRARLEAEAKAKGTTAQNIGQKMGHSQKKLFSTTATRCAMDYNKRWRYSRNFSISDIYKPLEQQQKDYLHLARKLYLKALEVEQHCPYNNARCAKGLWTMPYPYKDKQRAQEAIIHAQTLAPSNSLVNHYAGMFYEYFFDKKNAMECYKRATRGEHFNYPAEMSYINLKMKVCPEDSPVSFLDQLLYKYSSPHYVVQTLCFKGYYLYTVEKKTLLAIRAITAAIITDPTHFVLKTFRPGTSFGQNFAAVNIYEFLKEMLHSYQKLPQKRFNQELQNRILEAARRITEAYTNNNQEKDSGME